jgi:hypothetical protein
MAELTPWWPEDSMTQKCDPAALRLSSTRACTGARRASFLWFLQCFAPRPVMLSVWRTVRRMPVRPICPRSSCLACSSTLATQDKCCRLSPELRKQRLAKN